VTRRAFEGIANGKQHVSLKDMLNWDFVYTLLAEVSTWLAFKTLLYFVILILGEQRLAWRDFTRRGRFSDHLHELAVC
jgi:hypothetical protein